MGSGSALALGVVLIAWAASMRALAGTWLHPSSFFALWWCFAGILPLVAAPNEVVGPQAMLWLLAASIAVSAGATAGNLGFRTRLLSAPAPATDRELLIFSAAVVVSVILGIGSNVAFVAGSNVPFSDLVDVEKLVVVSNRLYVQRYDEIPPAPPLLGQALLPFVFLGPAAGGILFVLRREKRWKLLALFSFVPAVVVTILQTTKAAVLFAAILWLSGYFATRLRFGKLSVFTTWHFLIAAALGGALTAFFFAVSLARMASTDASLLDLVLRKLLTAALGHMTVFSQWLAEYWSQPDTPALGTLVFAGPLEMLGYGHRIPGLFESVIDLVIGETSNIYTAFRPLIQDFTIPGALCILTLLGFVGGTGFRLVASGRLSGLPLLLIAYYTTMWSPITWFWIYNSLTATLVALTVLVLGLRVWRGRLRKDIFPVSDARAT
ncbi:MAG: O-antigen polymerase [Gemmatimonadaceae bacterium]